MLAYYLSQAKFSDANSEARIAPCSSVTIAEKPIVGLSVTSMIPPQTTGITPEWKLTLGNL
jgi:hypothetical protein